jgi:uncharacterized membrane protein
VLYIVLCAVLSPYGGIGLLIANSCNMIARIIYSVVFIATFMRYNHNVDDYSLFNQLVRDAILRPVIILLLSVSCVITWISAINFDPSPPRDVLSYKHAALHVAIGAICVLITLGGVWRFERHFFAALRSIRLGHRD